LTRAQNKLECFLKQIGGIVGVASLIISIIALVVAIVGLVPFLGWVGWIALALGVVAFALGIIPLAQKRRSGAGIAGFIISILVLVLAIIRLIWGGGIL
jgi:hypothetical protein